MCGAEQVEQLASLWEWYVMKALCWSVIAGSNLDFREYNKTALCNYFEHKHCVHCFSFCDIDSPFSDSLKYIFTLRLHWTLMIWSSLSGEIKEKAQIYSIVMTNVKWKCCLAWYFPKCFKSNKQWFPGVKPDSAEALIICFFLNRYHGGYLITGLIFRSVIYLCLFLNLPRY